MAGADKDGLPVSIHAPREGCDLQAPRHSALFTRFQFTHPVRGATEATPCTIKVVEVSIHAPREGCDLSGL